MFFKKKYLLFILILYSSYISIIIGESWDENYHYVIGKNVFNYLFTFGIIDKELDYREFYSPSLWVFKYLISLIFPANFKLEIFHLINLSISLTTIFGIKKICKVFFNKEIADYSFVILFLFPIYFGHMSINPKDTVLAACNVWTTYYLIKYLIYPKKKRPFNFFFKISLLTTIGTGIQFFYIGSLIPVIIFFILDAFYFKKIIKKKFDNNFFFKHLIKSFLIFVSFFFLFWVDSHSNIFIEPFQIIKRFLNDLVTGWPYNLTNGIYFESSNTPLNYYFVNIFFKSPEYIIISYCIFFLFFIFKNNYFSKRIIEFNYKIYFISFVILFPTLVIYIISFPIYDGLRLFLWSVAYISIIPAILLDFLFKHKNKYKLIITSFFFLFIYFIVKFLTISPYHYTYVNFFVGNKEVSKMFENDYWGVSLNELIEKINLEKNLELKISTCGLGKRLVEKYLKKNNFKKVIFVSYDEADFVIMNNRTFNPYGDNKNITNCLLHFDGVDLASVKRNDVTLSVFRQIRK